MTPDAPDFLFAPSVDRFTSISGERIEAIDMHTAGEPTRIILNAPSVPAGVGILARRREAQSAWDRYRRILMFEPRGHQDMYGALVLPPVSPQAHFGVLFLHNEGYSTMWSRSHRARQGCGRTRLGACRRARNPRPY